MTRRSTPRLRVAPPTLEPGQVLLYQLTELSACSSPAARTARYAGVRALAGAATVAVIGATTWVAGAAPGTGFNAGPADRPTQESIGVTSPGGVVVSPQSDDTTSVPGSPWSPGLPGNETLLTTVAPGETVAAEKTGAPDRAGAADETGAPADTGVPDGPGQQPAEINPGNGNGPGNSHGKGHAYGHDKSSPGKHSANRGDARGNAKIHDRRHGNGHDKSRGHGKSHDKGHDKGHGKSRGNDRRKGHH